MVSLAPFEDLFLIPMRSGLTVNKNMRGSGIRMVNMRELFKYPLLRECEMVRVPRPAQPSERYLLAPGDLLFARRSLTAEGAGKCALVVEVAEDTTWESSILRARLDQTVADPWYYYYYFRSPFGRASIENIVEQVAAAGIRGSDLRQILVPRPPLPHQRVISGFMKALDDKIAMNARTEQLLLELARVKFVELRADSDAWDKTTFGQFVSVYGGGTPSTKEPSNWGGRIMWATPTDVTALRVPYLFRTARTITEQGLNVCASRLHPRGSILLTSRATIGALAVADDETAVNQGFIVLVPHEREHLWYLLHELESRREELHDRANGSTFLEISRSSFKEMPLSNPPTDKLGRWHRKVDILHAQARALALESEKLTELRDRLLPKLMSGEIRVRDAEKLVEEAV